MPPKRHQVFFCNIQEGNSWLPVRLRRVKGWTDIFMCLVGSQYHGHSAGAFAGFISVRRWSTPSTIQKEPHRHGSTKPVIGQRRRTGCLRGDCCRKGGDKIKNLSCGIGYRMSENLSQKTEELVLLQVCCPAGSYVPVSTHWWIGAMP